MLVYDVSQIPPEGIDIDSVLGAADLHVEGEDSFAFQGGRLVGRLEKGDDRSAHLVASLSAGLGLECSRCLAGFTHPLEERLDLFYLPHRPDQGEEEEDEVQLTDRDMVVAYYHGDRLDLGEVIREQLLLGVPMKRLCRPECRGLCPACGANRNASACECRAEATDARLAVLGTLLTKDEP